MGGAIYETGMQLRERFPSNSGIRPIITGAASFAGAMYYSKQLLSQRQSVIKRWTDDDKPANLASSIGIGFAARLATLLTVGETWSDDESVWTAFRALIVLEGFWQGAGRSGDVKLQDLVHPESLRAVVLPAIKHNWYQQWVADVLDNYEQSLRDMYPQTAIAEIVDRVADIRHLVHGTGTDRSDNRGRRLEALRGIDGSAGLALIRDVAVFWWTAVLLDANANARMGSPPMAIRHWRT